MGRACGPKFVWRKIAPKIPTEFGALPVAGRAWALIGEKLGAIEAALRKRLGNQERANSEETKARRSLLAPEGLAAEALAIAKGEGWDNAILERAGCEEASLQNVIATTQLSARVRKKTLEVKQDHWSATSRSISRWVEEQHRTSMGALFALMRPRALFEPEPIFKKTENKDNTQGDFRTVMPQDAAEAELQKWRQIWERHAATATAPWQATTKPA